MTITKTLGFLYNTNRNLQWREVSARSFCECDYSKGYLDYRL